MTDLRDPDRRGSPAHPTTPPAPGATGDRSPAGHGDPGSFIAWYAEPLGHGRAVMRADVVAGGALVMSWTDGSPAPLATVRAHEHRTAL
jgi:hypothetical protein